MRHWRETLFYNIPVTKEQEVYLDSIFSNILTIVNASSGTGKTTLAVGAAKLIGRPLLYIINPVEEDEMGFRPGGQFAKESSYFRGLRKALVKVGENPEQAIKNPDEVGSLKAGKAWVEATTPTFFRGDDIEDTTVILDEVQNYTRPKLKKMLTRFHDSCTVICIGHTGQCDLKDPKQSGFPRMLEYYPSKPYAQICTLTKDFRGQLSRDADEM